MAHEHQLSDTTEEPPHVTPLPVEHSTFRQEMSRFVHLRWSMRTWRLLVALTGAALAILLAGSVHQRVGPVDTTMALKPAVHGDTRVAVPPLGALRLDTHDGPLQLAVTVDAVRIDDARNLFSDPERMGALQSTVTNALKEGFLHLLIKSVLVAIGGAVLLTLVVYRRLRDAWIAAVVALAALVAIAGFGRLTWRSDALKTPTYTGALKLAPQAIGSVQDLESNFTKYGDELSKIVTNVSKLYDVTSALPSAPSDQTIRILFVSDIHDNTNAYDVIRSVIGQFGVTAVIDAGDESDHGLALENSLYDPIRTLGVPYVFVRGNHDSTATADYLRTMPNVELLDNTETIVHGIRIAGSGDPMFTPDQSKTIDADTQTQLLTDQGNRLATLFGATPQRAPGADVVVVHEPPAAVPLFGRVPLVLAGHTHQRDASVHAGTQLLVQGSTGGAGLRGLEHTTPTPLDLSVLYFDPTTHRLVAYDDLELGGLGETSVNISRHAVTAPELQVPGAPVPPPGPSTTPPPPPTPTDSDSGTPSATATPTSTGSVAAAGKKRGEVAAAPPRASPASPSARR